MPAKYPPNFVEIESKKEINWRMISTHESVTTYQCIGLTAEGERWAFKIKEHYHRQAGKWTFSYCSRNFEHEHLKGE